MLDKVIAVLLSVGLAMAPIGQPGAAMGGFREMFTSTPVGVNAQQAIYEKYTVVVQRYDGYTLTFPSGYTSCATSGGYWDYSFDELRGTVQSVGPEGIDREQSCTFYLIFGPKDIRRVIQEYDEYRNRCSQKWTSGSIWKTELQRDTKGDYVGDILAKSGSLPQDGKGEDGFWYVFKKNMME